MTEASKAGTSFDLREGNEPVTAEGMDALRTKDVESGQSQTWTLVGPTEADPKQRKLSAESPAGRALRDAAIGEDVKFETPRGVKTYRIEELACEGTVLTLTPARIGAASCREEFPSPSVHPWETAAMKGPRTGSEPLDLIARGLEEAGWAAFMFDSDWRFVWISSEFKALVGETDSARLGLGQHTLAVQGYPAWDLFDPEFERAWLLFRISLILADTDKTAEELANLASGVLERPQHREHKDALTAQIHSLSPLDWPAWTSRVEPTVGFPDLGGVLQFGTRLRDHRGRFLGAVELYVTDVPATLAVSLTRGDRAMYERMSALSEPGRREAAILFADLEGSANLAHHLPSATYFELIRALTSGVDQAVADAGGVVGRHAGDGVTAFFLAESLGSPEAASLAATKVGLQLNPLASQVAGRLDLDRPSILLNIGLHWGATVYMGQLTGGRLEVTALGDEVNECARVQESAQGGSVLATKDFLERLDPDAAEQLGVDLDAISYVMIAELETASQKAIRDAGELAVCRMEPISD